MPFSEKEWFIQAPWGRLSIMAWGDCMNPPVLLCHGAMDCAVSFRPLVALLPETFYYIGVELPGNGKSDPYPPGLMINAYDLVHVIEVVVKHFRWEQLVFIGHSIGTLVGKLYNLSYPGKISKVVELDPGGAYHVVPPEEFPSWYHRYFTWYYNKYDKMNSPRDKAPKYTWDEAVDMVAKSRGLPEEKAALVVERATEPAGDGYIRFTFDQRFKDVTRPPLPLSHMEKLYTSIRVPILATLASVTIQYYGYSEVPFVLDEKSFPAGNYRVRLVDGVHDVHFTNPERVAPFVSQFLLDGLEGLDRKAKL